MNRIFRYLFSLLLFWYTVFQFFRLIELFAWRPLWKAAGINDALGSFIYGWRLDFSMAAYLSIVPFFLTVISFLFSTKTGFLLARIVVLVEIISYCMIAVGETVVYPEWKTKLNMQALEHFAHPSEVFEVISIGLIVGFFSSSAILGAFFLWIYNRWVSPASVPTPAAEGGSVWIRAFIPLLLSFVFLLTGMRGGFSRDPAGESEAYFCDSMVPDDIAVNTAFHFAANYLRYRNRLTVNPFLFMPEKKAQVIVDSLYAIHRDTTEIFLANRRPNIVFIIMESLSANCSKAFGGDDFTPQLDSLARDGVLFSNIYPAGWISEQGVPTVLSGHPATSGISFILQDSKLSGLPCISEDIKKAGYYTGFIYGGHLEYSNFRHYLQAKGFDQVLDQKDMPDQLTRTRLGVCDVDMAGQAVEALDAARPPFFYSWYTLNSHSPYDLPEPKIELTDFENEYVNAVRYTDKALGLFFKAAKKRPWYSNTLFVIVADHSHGSQRNLPNTDKEYHRIPLLFYGPAVKENWRGKSVDRIFSQMDIVPTVLRQLGLDASAYRFGKNMFNPYTPQFAPFSFYDGAGFITPDGFTSLKEGKPGIAMGKGKDPSTLNKLDSLARIFRQVVYGDFLRR